MLALAGRIVDLATVLLAIAVAIVVGNTIRLEINNRSVEIEVTKLVGGTDGFIRRPFLYLGLCYGLAGAVARGGPGGRRPAALLEPPVRDLAALYGSGFALDRPVAARDRDPRWSAAPCWAGSGAWLATARHLRGHRARSSRPLTGNASRNEPVVSTLRTRVLILPFAREVQDMTTTALAPRQRELVLSGPVGSLDQYIQAASADPGLERRRGTRARDPVPRRPTTSTPRGASCLSHLRFVVHVARGYAGYGLQIGDLIQEGNVGLMKAVKRFDPNVGVRLVSFAVHWIRAEIHEYVLRNWRLVSVATTKAQRKLFFNLRKAKKRLGWLNRDETEAVANDLGVTPREVNEMEQRLSGYDVSFDPDPTDDEDFAPAAYLPSPNSDPAKAVEREDSDADAHDRLDGALGQARRAQPRHPRAPLAHGRQGHAARARGRVRRVGGAHSADRGERDREAARTDGRGLKQRSRTRRQEDRGRAAQAARPLLFSAWTTSSRSSGTSVSSTRRFELPACVRVVRRDRVGSRPRPP